MPIELEMMIQLCFNWCTILTYIKCSFIIIWQSVGRKEKTNTVGYHLYVRFQIQHNEPIWNENKIMDPENRLMCPGRWVGDWRGVEKEVGVEDVSFYIYG